MFLLRFSWPRKHLVRPAPPVPRRAARPRPRWTPLLEALEDRWLPSPVTHVRDIGTAVSVNPTAKLSIPVAAAVAAGHSVLVEVATGVTGGNSISVSDSAGNFYTLDAGVANPANGQVLIFSAHGVRPLAAGSVITVHLTSPEPLDLASASEFAGLDAAIPLDRASAAFGNSNLPSSGSTPTAQASELLLGAIETVSGPSPPALTPGAGYALLPGAVGTTLGGSLSLDPESRIVAAQNFYAADGTLSSSAEWAAALSAYRADTATHFGVIPSAAGVPPGQPFSVTVTALDDGGHAAAGYTGTVHFSSSDALAGLPADYAFTAADHGSHTFTVVLGTRGPQSIQVRDVLASSLAGSGTVAATPFDATAQVATLRSRVIHLANGKRRQKLELFNLGASPLPGPVWLVFDHLNPPLSKPGPHRTPRIVVENAQGVTTVLPPLGSPYVKVTSGALNPGASAAVTVTFDVPRGRRLTYTLRVLVGPGPL